MRFGLVPNHEWAQKMLDAEDDTDIQELGVLAMETLGGFHGKDQ
ncbi:MAG: hypothetical protein OSB46_09870 [Alphaproteobacteria bacterium]|nr:hypothetical protein [Alphaproteobacteria bacterium]